MEKRKDNYMLIRSKDKKTLVHMEALKKIQVDTTSNRIIAIYSDNEKEFLGEYSTKEKAMEILNDIVNIYENCFGNIYNKIFQMPQDNDVYI